MSFDFPNTPSVGDLFQDSSSGAVYRWNGYAWVGGVAQQPGVYQPLLGVTDGSNAPAGQIGEVIGISVTASVSLTTAVITNIANLSLTPGDWDVSGEAWFNLTGVGAMVIAGLGLSATTLPSSSALNTSYSRAQFNTAQAAGTYVLPLRPCRVNITATTMYYLTVRADFTSGTANANGNIIARRAR